jgi:hypothetical protein
LGAVFVAGPFPQGGGLDARFAGFQIRENAPVPASKRLIIELHGQTNPAHDTVVEHLCIALNQTETQYPGTALTLFYRPLRSS